MQRKICAVGNSRGVLIPVDVLSKLNLSTGSEVEVRLDESKRRIVIEPVKKVKHPKGVDREFVSQVNDFIKKYQPALKELARK